MDCLEANISDQIINWKDYCTHHHAGHDRQDNNQHRFNSFRDLIDLLIQIFLVNLRALAHHLVDFTRLFANLDHLRHHRQDIILIF